MTPDPRHMDRALALAARGAGRVAPNPLVGAVFVGPEGEVLGEGWHGAYGGHHAEVWAMLDAERRGLAHLLPESTLYVTLEPCNHHGKTPPCTDLILERGIPRVVAALEDPFRTPTGGGLDRLRAAGVDVRVGVRRHEAARLVEPFTRHVTTGRPFVTLKLAQTLDGRVATASGDSRWISGEAARTTVHRWRHEHGAVLVGAGTARADDPELTVRHVPLPEGAPQPLRVVLDRAGALPPSLRLFTDAHTDRTLAVVGEEAWPAYAADLTARGGRLIRLPQRGGHLDLPALLDALGQGVPPYRRQQALLVEAGPRLATAFLRQGLADRLQAFVAPKLAGGDARPAFTALGVEAMADALTFAEHRWEPIGEDLLFTGHLHAVG
jgi:diaminohydroxyphosphoribosylaminopyrimidine deaminase / 5-amino-6-(5-phosphoribosylamino)uracil reductase